MKIFVASVVSALFTTCCFAAGNDEWIYMAGNDSASLSAHANRWKVTGKNELQAWIKTEFKKPEKGSKTKYTMSDWRINCKDTSIYVASTVAYDSAGNSLGTSKNTYGTYEPVIPESVGESIANVFCDASRERRENW
ncbi:hypothetical protein JAO85_13945 [Comamonas sp. NyZ500]|uniref:surface-adhesin E family protein n=1 Tax=Comamonas sp. NyZ500 TaxID=2795732 RepID=UPI00192AC6DF|nr:surface-adhesin E family protein [Comamonas sp. NyZ500]MBL5978387.1 hypothetical protein [Comamonas sp. NyZ500]